MSLRRTSFLVGLIGAGIQESRAPAMHECEGAAQGLNYVYRLIDLDGPGFDVRALPELIRTNHRMIHKE